MRDYLTAVAFEDVNLHRFSITEDYFGYEVWGTYNSYSYEIYLSEELELVDFDLKNIGEIKGITEFLKNRIKEGVKAGLYDGDIPIHVRKF